tara:strand:- start:796 stop:1053 length:258 start_codon:yes stop_codon:yes gene_type:complete
MIDPWKRSLPSAADDAANVMSGYEQQLEINFKPAEATKEQIEKWEENLNWWAKIQLPAVAVMSIIQLSMLGLMAMTMYLIKLGVG